MAWYSVSRHTTLFCASHKINRPIFQRHTAVSQRKLQTWTDFSVVMDTVNNAMFGQLKYIKTFRILAISSVSSLQV